MAEALTIANALRLAHACLEDARLLANSGSRNAAYLAEQAVEQLIRALATSEGLHIDRADAHQLDKTVRRLPDANPEKAEIAALTWIEAYATTFRYTTTSGRIPRSPDERQLAALINDADRLIRRLAERFGVDLENDTSPARNPKPIR